MEGLLFDLDGVLVDTQPLVEAAALAVAQGLKLSPPDAATCNQAATLSPAAAAKYLFPHQEDAAARLHTALNQRVRDLVPCAGILNLLEAVQAYRLGVVTSRNRQQATRFLHSAGLADFFPVVITWGDTHRHKPYPDPLQAASSRLGIQGGIYIGDTPGDMVAALAANVTPVGAAWAVSSNATALRQAGAVFVADHPREIVAYLATRSAGAV